MSYLRRIQTVDEADLAILSLASDKFKFAIEVGMPFDEPTQLALERGMENEWFTLIDVTTNLPAAPGRLMRVFRLTKSGIGRLAELTKMSMEGIGHG